MAIDTDPQQQEAASPQRVVIRSFLRWKARMRSLLGIVLTTLFFGALGPMIGGLPVNILLVPIVASYMVGTIPALVTGFVFSLVLTFGRRWFRTQTQHLMCGGIVGGVAMFVVVFFLYAWISAPTQELIRIAVDLRHAAGRPPGIQDDLAIFAFTYLMIVPLVGAGVAGGGACAWLLPKFIRNLLVGPPP